MSCIYLGGTEHSSKIAVDGEAVAQAQEFLLHIAESEARSRVENMLTSMPYNKNVNRL